MTSLVRTAARLSALALVAALAACSPASPDRTPDTTPDAGPVNDCTATKSARHESLVPASVHPTDAKRIIVLGDSISTGTGAATENLSYFALLEKNDVKWTSEISTTLATKFGHDVELVNVAQDGATTGSMAQQQPGRIDTAFAAGRPSGHSIVVITIGGNDLQAAIQGSVLGGVDPAGKPLDDAIANLRTTVAYLQDPAKFPDGTSIYIATVYDPSDGEGHIDGCFFGLTLPAFVTALDTWRTRYKALGAELGFSVVDSLGHFHGHGHNFDHTTNQYYQAADPTGWFYDCIHPNDRGHDELRRLFYEAVDCQYVATP